MSAICILWSFHRIKWHDTMEGNNAKQVASWECSSDTWSVSVGFSHINISNYEMLS